MNEKTFQIVFFYQYFGTPKGSWSTRVYELTRRWVEAGHSVTVITAPYDKSDIKSNGFIHSQRIKGIKVIVINSGDSNRLRIWKRMLRAVLFSIMSIYYALRLNYDVAIASSGPMTIGLPMIAAKVFRRKKTVFEVRDLWPSGGVELGLIKQGWPSRLAFAFERLCYNKADRIVTASIGQRNHILDRYPHKFVEVIPNASDLDLFGNPQNTSLPEWTHGKFIFTHIGSLGLIHNTTFWLEVAFEIQKLDQERKIELVFLGDGVDREKLESEHERLGLQNLRFLGLKPKSELPVWVQRSTATLFATTANPVQDTSSPNKIFDSFAAGVPIVQTSKGWIKDLVEKENCGVNVSLEDPQEAARIIIGMTQSQDALDAKSKNAKRLANTTFNRDLLSDKYLEIIKSLQIDSKESLRIVYFYQYFGTPNGSWSTRVYELCKRWVEQGYVVTVVTSPYYKSDIRANKFLSKINIEGIEVIIINAADSNKFSFFKRMVNAIVFAIMSIYYSTKLPYDISICSSGPLTIGLPGLISKWIRRKKLVFEVRDLWPQGSIELGKIKSNILIKLAFWFEKVCYTNADLVIPCSVDMEKSIVQRFPKTKTCVIPNASDSSFYTVPHEDPKVYPDFVHDKDVILYAGSLGLMDDCIQIINAAKLLQDTNVAIVFAGDGAEKELLEKEVEEHDLHNVYFTGLLPKKDIIKWFFLSKASLITFKNLPVLSSNSPNKMFDSFAAGVPIIQTTKGWIKDLVDQEYCGLNAEPHDAQSLADSILYMIDNTEKRNEMAANALRLAKTDFNRDHLSIEYMEGLKAIGTPSAIKYQKMYAL